MSTNSFLIIILNILLLSTEQFLDKNVLKAAGCVTLIKKLPNKPEDKKITTYYLLSCFININEETADQILQSQYYEKIGIDDSQVMNLLDIKSLEQKYTPEQINEYSILLNKALEPLKDNRAQKNKESNDEQYGYGYNDPNQNNEENEGLINYIIKLFTSSDSLIVLTIFFVVAYFCLQKMRKCFKKEDNDTKKKNNNNNKKNSRNNKKKKN